LLGDARETRREKASQNPKIYLKKNFKKEKKEKK
jgi:hypothetical protein